jgi:pseudaminic acid cytidylyltransferase
MIIVIPARSGSKRIPGKNIKIFNGKPILSLTIERLKKFDFVDKIYVSTDDSRIMQIAEESGAKTLPLRPEELSTDHANTLSVIKYEISNLGEEVSGKSIVTCVYPTSVFVRGDDLLLSKELALKNPKSFVISASRFTHPIQRAFQIDSNKKISIPLKSNFTIRTQDLEKNFHDAAQFYTSNASNWINEESIINSNTMGLEIPVYGQIDIDEIEDWKFAEMMQAYLESDSDVISVK